MIKFQYVKTANTDIFAMTVDLGPMVFLEIFMLKLITAMNEEFFFQKKKAELFVFNAAEKIQ